MVSTLIPPLIAERMLIYIHRVHAHPQILIKNLRLLTLPYLNFEGEKKEGHLVVHASLAEEVVQIFLELFEDAFPIEKMRLIEEYEASDDASMEDNNSSAFCYREAVYKPGVISKHSFGRAIDINPLYNPYVKGDLILPSHGNKFVNRSLSHPAMITKEGPCYKAFVKRGWIWGGSWPDRQDYHHFEKD